MMKTHRFELGSWFPPESDGSGNIYIDWPAVHRQAGKEHIQWLKNQDPYQCQMIVERRKEDYRHYLVAEIYSDKLATLYSLMWAK